MRKIPYDPDHLKDFDTEWGLHKKAKEWWYATAVVFDADGNMYTYQYTLLHIDFGMVTSKMAMIALTDYKNNEHHYLQTPITWKNRLALSKNEASVRGVAELTKTNEGMTLELTQKYFHVKATMENGKGAFWHCDNGKLQMGIPGEAETTEYFSYTNMPTTGVITLHGKDIPVTGKTWFDKQGGSYSISDSRTNWEWFSLRFNDDEEAMLFTFPQNDPPYFDGTFITKSGTRERMNDYTIERTAITEYNGVNWSAGWKLHMNKKEQDYAIEPVAPGHINFRYFEEVCTIKNKNSEVVGYAFAELLPGVLGKSEAAKAAQSAQPKKRSKVIKSLFERVEV